VLDRGSSVRVRDDIPLPPSGPLGGPLFGWLGAASLCTNAEVLWVLISGSGAGRHRCWGSKQLRPTQKPKGKGGRFRPQIVPCAFGVEGAVSTPRDEDLRPRIFLDQIQRPSGKYGRVVMSGGHAKMAHTVASARLWYGCPSHPAKFVGWVGRRTHLTNSVAWLLWPCHELLVA
jgi:hypothetical protein